MKLIIIRKYIVKITFINMIKLLILLLLIIFLMNPLIIVYIVHLKSGKLLLWNSLIFINLLIILYLWRYLNTTSTLLLYQLIIRYLVIYINIIWRRLIWIALYRLWLLWWLLNLLLSIAVLVSFILSVVNYWY